MSAESETQRSVSELAEAYLDAIASSPDETHISDEQDEAEEFKERYELFASDYSEDDPLTQDAKSEWENAKTRVDQLESQRDQPEELRHELLTRATKFMSNEEWLSPVAIEALNHALVGIRRDVLVIDEVVIESTSDIEALDVSRLDIIDTIRKLAMDAVGEDVSIRTVWESIENTKKEPSFHVVVELGGADPDDLLERLDDSELHEAKDPYEKARSRIKSTIYQLDYNPYVRDEGIFHLNLVGEYIAKNYAGHDDIGNGHQQDNRDPPDDGKNNGQVANNALQTGDRGDGQ